MVISKGLWNSTKQHLGKAMDYVTPYAKMGLNALSTINNFDSAYMGGHLKQGIANGISGYARTKYKEYFPDTPDGDINRMFDPVQNVANNAINHHVMKQTKLGSGQNFYGPPGTIRGGIGGPTILGTSFKSINNSPRYDTKKMSNISYA